MGDNTRLKKGPWTSEEDERLSAYIRAHGRCTWSKLPIYAGLNRCGKSCRLRWMNYLRPDLKRGSFTKSEEELILILHDKFGTSWSKIAAGLPGRSDNEIKNYWHTHLKEKSRKRTKPKNAKSVPKPSRQDNISFAILESSSVRDLLLQKFQESSPVTIVKDPEPKEVYPEVEAFPLPELAELKIMLKAFDENETLWKPDSEFEHMDYIISVLDFPVSPQTSDVFTPHSIDDFVMENLATDDTVTLSEPSQEHDGNDQIVEEVVNMKNQVTGESAMSSQLDWSYWKDEFTNDKEVPVLENKSVDTNQMPIMSELDPVYWNEFSALLRVWVSHFDLV